MSKTTVTLTGNVVADPVRRSTLSKDLVVTFSVAVNERKLDSSGAWVDGVTSFYRVSAFGRLATNIAGSIAKGHPVVVQGTQRISDFVANDGTNRREVEIRASHVGHDLARGSTVFSRQTATLRDVSTADQSEESAVPEQDSADPWADRPGQETGDEQPLDGQPAAAQEEVDEEDRLAYVEVKAG